MCLARRAACSSPACPAALIISVNFPLIGSLLNLYRQIPTRFGTRGEVGSRRFLRGRGRDRRKPAPV